MYMLLLIKKGNARMKLPLNLRGSLMNFNIMIILKAT